MNWGSQARLMSFRASKGLYSGLFCIAFFSVNHPAFIGRYSLLVPYSFVYNLRSNLPQKWCFVSIDRYTACLKLVRKVLFLVRKHDENRKAMYIRSRLVKSTKGLCRSAIFEEAMHRSKSTDILQRKEQFGRKVTKGLRYLLGVGLGTQNQDRRK